MSLVKIYTLSDPRTGEVRYIGKTEKSLGVRLSNHCHDTIKCHRTNWINSLSKLGMRPSIELLDEVDREVWEQEERFYISYFRFLGFNLTNGTSGGSGYTGKQKPISKETRSKLGQHNKVPIVQLGDNMEFIAEWPSIREFSIAQGKSRTTAGTCLFKGVKCNGYYLVRKKDYNPEVKNIKQYALS